MGAEMYTSGGAGGLPDYQKMYAELFNAVTDALELLEKKETERPSFLLMAAQRRAEEIYLETAE